MASLAQHFAPGTIVGGRYRIEALIGQGGFGAVFRATQLNLDRPVALKALLPEALGDDGLARFQREAAIVQQLSHPNVVRLLDFGVAGADPYLIFELLQGQTLEEAIRAAGPLPAARVARVAAQVLKALMEAHARGIVHRDIKPANVFLCNFQGEPDFVKLLDFGIAKGADTRPLTQRGGVIGTPAYMAPEQVTGGEATFATDLYALGLTMEEALTGRPVFEGAALVDIVRAHLSPSPVPHAPSALQSPLGPVLHRATQKAPAQRYPSAAEMLAHLDAVTSFALPHAPHAYATPPVSAAPGLAFAPTALPVVPAGYPLVPPPPTTGKRGSRASRKKGRRAPWAVFAALGVGALAIGGALLGVLSLGRGREPAAGAKGRPGPSAAASGGAAPGLIWLRVEPELNLVETQANADGVPDVVGYCSVGPFSGPHEICAIDGATFRTLWRRPLGFDSSSTTNHFLSAAGRSVVSLDPGGVVHLIDAATGVESGALRLGSRADWMCAPPELPGKVWIRTKPVRGWLLDTTTRTTVDAPRPASCPKGQREFYCDDPRFCPHLGELRLAGISLGDPRVEGGRGVARAHKNSDLSFAMLVGFEPVISSSAALPPAAKIVWQRPLAPGDGLAATGTTHLFDLGLAAGRAVSGYDTASGTTRLVAVDATSGRTLWEVTTPPFNGLVLTRTRVYLGHARGLEVRDAATGQLLGGVGPTGD